MQLLQVVTKKMLTILVLLLGAALVLFFYLRLSAVGERKDFRLSSLIPSSAVALFVAPDIREFVAEVEGLTSTQEGQYLYTSKLLFSLKEYYHSMREQVPHGMSAQMNRVVISFHEPDSPRNQVLYFRLGRGDYECLDRYFQESLAVDYPFKRFDYKGQSIRIYATDEGDFLSCCLTPEFLVISYQKKLIEEVIDAWKGEKSLARETAYVADGETEKHLSTPVLYACWEPLMGWTEFQVTLKGDCIYLTGSTPQGVTPADSRADVWCRQEPLQDFVDAYLPRTTCYYTYQGVSNWQALLSEETLLPEQTASSEYTASSKDIGLSKYTASSENTMSSEQTVLPEEALRERDQQLARFLMEQVQQRMFFSLFLTGDSLTEQAAVLGLAVSPRWETVQAFQQLLQQLPALQGERPQPRTSFVASRRRSYVVYHLPATQLFAHLAGIHAAPAPVYATFYGDYLLWAPEKEHLAQYIRQLEAQETLAQAPFIQEGIGGLVDEYHWMGMADLEPLLTASAASAASATSAAPATNRLRYLPAIFVRHADYFRRYRAYVQLVSVDGTVCPNIVLKHR